MLQILQAFRIGVINLFGVTVPGFLMILFIVLGLFVPIVNIDFIFSDNSWQIINEIYYRNTFIFIFLVIILSYVIGYILRLSSPDDLDKISAGKVLKKLPKEEKEVWPYTGQDDDKFPYLNLQKYLIARDLEHLLKYVKWGGAATGAKKRSKTLVNIMKIDIMRNYPILYTIVESNEAHIRLMSGTWLAIKNTKYFVLSGALISALTCFYLNNDLLSNFLSSKLSYHSVFFLLLIFLFLSMLWAQRRIENLFHYRRVNELLYIIQSAYLAREEPQNNCSQNPT